MMWLFKEKGEPNPPEQHPQAVWGTEALDGMTLINHHQAQIKRIYQQVSMGKQDFADMYVSAFAAFAEIVQQAPASQNHHHRYAGGLLEHSLEVVYYTLKYRQGILYHTSTEEMISQNTDLFTYAVALGALLHDIGKIVVDIEIVDKDGRALLPLTDFAVQPGQRYAMRYRTARRTHLHDNVSLALFNKIVPHVGINWIYTNNELMLDLFTYLSGNVAGAGVLGEVISKADQKSTKESLANSHPSSPAGECLSASTQSQHNEPQNTLADKIVEALRRAAHDEDLPMNRPGAAAWCTAEYIHLVSKRAIDIARESLSAINVQLPKDPARVFNLLSDESLIIPIHGQMNPKVTILDGEWNKQLTLLTFHREQLDPRLQLPIFQGQLQIEGVSVAKIIAAANQQAAQTKKPEPPNGQTNPTDSKNSQVTEDDSSHQANPNAQCDKKQNPFAQNLQSQMTKMKVSSKKQRHGYTKNSQGISRNISEEIDFTPVISTEVFFKWIQNEISCRLIEVNTAGSSIHMITNDNAFLVSPAAFVDYIKAKTGTKEVDKSVINSLQRELIKSGNIQSNVMGEMIFQATFSASTKRRTARIWGMALNKETTLKMLGNIEMTQNSFLKPIAGLPSTKQ